MGFLRVALDSPHPNVVVCLVLLSPMARNPRKRKILDRRQNSSVCYPDCQPWRSDLGGLAHSTSRGIHPVLLLRSLSSPWTRSFCTNGPIEITMGHELPRNAPPVPERALASNGGIASRESGQYRFLNAAPQSALELNATVPEPGSSPEGATSRADIREGDLPPTLTLSAARANGYLDWPCWDYPRRRSASAHHSSCSKQRSWHFARPREFRRIAKRAGFWRLSADCN